MIKVIFSSDLSHKANLVMKLFLDHYKRKINLHGS